MSLSTPLTKLLKIKHPVMLAGMGGAAGPELAAAVTNAGGIGTIGGGGLSPNAMRNTIDELKENLVDKNAPFGVDLLLPQVGGSARKTNKDYTGGKLDELTNVMIEKGAALFVCAVGVPPRYMVDKLHAAGILVMNMVGAVKHVPKALNVGVDIICCQGGEGGGHTGEIPTSILIPKVVDQCKGCKSPMTGEQVIVVAAGGIFDGRGLAMALSMGAAGVWVGTRFVNAEEAGAGPYHQKLLKQATYTDTIKTLIYTGRPARVYRTKFVDDWETNKQHLIKEATSKGIVPVPVGNERNSYVDKLNDDAPLSEWMKRRIFIMGQAAGAIDDVLPAKAIVDQMVDQAVEHLQVASKYVKYVNAISTTTQQQTKRKVASNATSSSSIMSSYSTTTTSNDGRTSPYFTLEEKKELKSKL